MKKVKNITNALKTVELWAGGREALAEKIGVTIHSLNQWVFRNRVPVEHIKKVVALGEGRVSCADFLPEPGEK